MSPKPAAATSKRTVSAKSKRTAPKKVAKPAAKARTPKRSAKPAPRADYGRPIAGFFAKQPAPLRPILEALRTLIVEAAPESTAKLKWGMPFFEIAGEMMCAIGGHTAHVNLILPGPPGTYADPGELLAGDGKTGRHLKLTSLAELPHDAVRGWLRTAAARARTP